MGFWRRLSRWLAPFAVTFSASSTPKPIDQMFVEMRGSGVAPRVGREEALSVPTVQKGRNLLCSIATLPLAQLNQANEVTRNPLLEQIDPDVPNVVMMAMTVEDLVFEGLAWWRIIAFGGDTYPVSARRLDPGTVSLDPPEGTPSPLPGGYDPRGVMVWVEGRPVPAAEMIRFDSPNPAVLKVGGRGIKRALLLHRAGALYADNFRPLDYFTPAEGADPVSDDEIADILGEWESQRRRRSTGYVPAALKYNAVDSPSPADLQLAELAKDAKLDIANAFGIDPEDLGVSTTSRTYTNAVDRRRDRINDVLAPYMRAITDRLSMGDVTKRGYRVVFDLDDYLKSNPTERWATYRTAKEIGVMDVAEIRAKEGLPVRDDLDEPTAPATPAAVADPASVDAARRQVAATFDDNAERLHFADLPVHEFAVDRQTRTIEGLALPYGKLGTKYGLKFRFERGALQWSEPARVKLLRDHDPRQAIGYATALTDTSTGLKVRFKVARGAAGDEALELAEDGVLDGLSVGVDFDVAADTVPDPRNKGALLVRRSDLREVSLTAMPSFDDARVTKVAASRDGGPMEPCATCGQQHAPGVACPTTNPAPTTTTDAPAAPAGLTLTDDQARVLLTRPGALQALVATPPPSNPVPEGGLVLSADQLDTLVQNGAIGTLLGLPMARPQPSAPRQEPPQRQVVNPARLTASTTVSEALPYRFDRKGNLTRGAQYDFSTDLIAGLRDRDEEALERAQEFMRAQFDVLTTDVNELNPDRQRPDLYVDQKDFLYPIWDSISKGTLADITPFTLPKFNSSSGLVAAHTEGVEPSSGSFTSTSQTITPSAVSGKVSLSRESWDQGGNPQLSGLVWKQMTRGWYEALEAAAVAALEALSPTTITLTLAAQDDVLVNELEEALAALQYVRGGFRMREFYLQVDLYKKLIAAVDGQGRKLLPILNPINASGTTSPFYGDVAVGGLRGRPAWALAASAPTATNSFLFDSADVSGWASAPQRLTFEQIEVRYVHVGIWGYKAIANTDLTGVRKISYGPGA